MSTKVIIGGPPQSGKSTISAGLIDSIRWRQQNENFPDVTFHYLTLDVTDNSLMDILQEGESVPRKFEEREWSPEAAMAKQEAFQDADQDLVIADAPGKVTDESKIVTAPADYMVLLCNNEKQDKISEWRDLADQNNIEIVVTLISHKESAGQEPYLDISEGQGALICPSRDDYNNHHLRSFDDDSRTRIRVLGKHLAKIAQAAD